MVSNAEYRGLSAVTKHDIMTVKIIFYILDNRFNPHGNE